MGKATKRKQEAELARQPDFGSILLKSELTEAKKKQDLLSYDPMILIKGYEDFAIRSLDSFEPRTRSLNTTTRGRELVRYAFNKYNPPGFLYSVWDEETPRQNRNYDYLFGLKEDFRLWYLALVQGKSLYKECTMGLLSKRETYHFSVCPYTFTVPEAIWYSVIRCIDENAPASIARKIAQTKISGRKIDEFWKGAARWFMKNQASVRQMNDLLDYIDNRHRENGEWYLKDQTLVGLQRAMHAWHREMYRTRTMVQHFEKWKGIDVKDCAYELGQGKKKVVWKFHQITTGKELAEEGNRQHHCVSSYGSQCNSGECSIWSLTSSTPQEGTKRALTIEVRRGGTIIQARGYANRAPRADELSILKTWAARSNFNVSRT